MADQLQTNFASDLRNILKCVFLMNSSQSANEEENAEEKQQPPASPVDLDEPSSSVQRQDSIEEEELIEDHEPTEERSKY